MYNIAKVAKGEILVYFNSIFDQLCKVRRLALRAESQYELGRVKSLTIGALAWRRLGIVREKRG
jgi:hypothetical protein